MTTVIHIREKLIREKRSIGQYVTKSSMRCTEGKSADKAWALLGMKVALNDPGKKSEWIDKVQEKPWRTSADA